jgi:hypothetical protein
MRQRAARRDILCASATFDFLTSISTRQHHLLNAAERRRNKGGAGTERLLTLLLLKKIVEATGFAPMPRRFQSH